MRALLLAAGYGVRLRPFTEHTPKPLLPVLNVPIIEYGLRLLRAHGIAEIAVNLHYLGEQVEEHLGDGSRFGVSIRYSWEPEILGTGGGIKRVADFLGGGTFLVMNADTLCDCDLTAAVARHRERGGIATMLVRDDPRVAQFGAVEYDARGRIVQIAGKVEDPPPCEGRLARALFTGVHIMEPRALDYIPDGRRVCVNEVAYPAMLARGEAVFADVVTGYWSDLGDPRRLVEANLDLLYRKATLSYFDPLGSDAILLGHGVLLRGTAVLRPPTLVGAGCRIADGAVVGPGAVLGRDCKIGEAAHIEESLLLPGTEAPPGTRYCRVIADRHGAVVAT